MTPMKNIPASFLFVMILAALFSACSDNTLKHYNLGVDYAEKGDLDLAVENWLIVLEERPDDIETNYNLGIALMELGRFSEAEKYLRSAAGAGSTDHEIYQALGKTLEAQDKLSEAKKSYNMAVAIRKNYPPSYVGLASCAIKQKQYKTAEKYSTIALRGAPRDREGNLILAKAYYEQENYDDAYAQLLSIRHTYPSDTDVLMLLGKVMFARHMYEDAAATLKIAGENGRSDSEFYSFLGHANFELNDFIKAEKYYQLSIFKDKTNPDPLIGVAKTYMKTGEYGKALAAWDKASLLKPDDSEIPLGISIVYINTRRFEDGAKILKKLITKKEFPVRALYFLGHTQMRMGEKENARKSFEEFINLWQGDKALIEEVNQILVTL